MKEEQRKGKGNGRKLRKGMNNVKKEEMENEEGSVRKRKRENK